MAAVDDLLTAQANIAATLASITAAPKPSYSIDGQSVSWSEYCTMLTTQLKTINDLIQQLGGPIEYVTQGMS